MNNKKWGVINLKGTSVDKKMTYPIEWCETLQQAYSEVMKGYALGEVNQAIIKLYQITDVEIKEK